MREQSCAPHALTRRASALPLAQELKALGRRRGPRAQPSRASHMCASAVPHGVLVARRGVAEGEGDDSHYYTIPFRGQADPIPPRVAWSPRTLCACHRDLVQRRVGVCERGWYYCAVVQRPVGVCEREVFFFTVTVVQDLLHSLRRGRLLGQLDGCCPGGGLVCHLPVQHALTDSAKRVRTVEREGMTQEKREEREERNARMLT